jgi:hypothetical protein
MLASCDRCAKKFDVTGKRPGAAFRCPSCGDGSIVVPAQASPPPSGAEELEELDEIAAGGASPAAAAPRSSSGAAAARRARGPQRRGREGAAAAGKAPNRLPLLAGGAIAIAIAAFFVMRGGGDAPADAGGRSDAPKSATSPVEVAATSAKASDPRAAYRDRLAALDRKDAAGRVALADFCAGNGMATEARQLRREALLIEPDLEAARLALGFERYQGAVPHLAGRWLDAADRKRAAAIEHLYGGAAAGQLARAATPYDVFMRAGDEFKRRNLSEFREEDWLYAYGKELMPQPFFVMIERPKQESKLEAYRREYAEILSSLYEAFFDRYEVRFKLEREIERPIRVIMFDSEASYSAHIARFPEKGYKDPEFIGGYYSPSEQQLIMWRGGMDVRQVLFHEGTHMFVHYAFSGKGFTPSRQSPWLQEGIAELFAGHKVETVEIDGEKHRRYVLGQFIPGRYMQYRMLLQSGRLFSVHDLVKIDDRTFQEAQKDQAEGGATGAQARTIVEQIYANGWVFCLYLNSAEGGRHKVAFDDYIEAETKGEGYWQKLGELLGLADDAAWAAFDEKVRKWAVDELPKMAD